MSSPSQEQSTTTIKVECSPRDLPLPSPDEQVHPASPDELKAMHEQGMLLSGSLVGAECDCDSDPDCPTLPLTPPVLVRDERYLKEYDEAILELQREHDATLLEIISRRVLARPKKAKKVKKRQDNLSDGGPKKRRRKTKHPIPMWLSKDATLDDLVAVLQMDQESDEIYVDVTGADAPYDTLTLPMVRHFIRKAREYPSMCSEWNTVAIKKGEERLSILMNGRNASRTDGAAALRAYAAMDVFTDKFGFTGITTNVLKDLGFGSKKAAHFRSAWYAGRELLEPLSDIEESLDL